MAIGFSLNRSDIVTKQFGKSSKLLDNLESSNATRNPIKCYSIDIQLKKLSLKKIKHRIIKFNTLRPT